MSVPALPLSQKAKAYAVSFLLVLVIYLVIDLYVPLKHLLAGHPLSFERTQNYLQIQKKLPIILVIGLALGKKRMDKKTQALRQRAEQEKHNMSPATAE